MSERRDRTSVEVRRISPADANALVAFFSGLPDSDRSFFKDDVTSHAVVRRFVDDSVNYRLVALVDGEIVGYAAVLHGWGWSRHVGELRIATSPPWRQRGIGRLLAQRLVMAANEAGTEKLTVDVVAGQTRLFDMFTKLGFEQEGRLRAHVRGTSGETRDLLVLSHFVATLAETLGASASDEG